MFLQKILPSEGLYCVAMALPKGGFKHFFHDNLDDADRRISVLDKTGHTAYIAQATFSPDKINEAVDHNSTCARTDRMKERSQSNAMLMKNFFLDIDCGEKWPLKNQKEAASALLDFVAETNIPMPAVVSSGNGLYAHWILDEAIPADQWRTIAFIFKRVVAEYSPGLSGDATRTSDSASVLRRPGTTNRKNGRASKAVSLIKDAEPITLDTFVTAVKTAAKKKKIQYDAVMPPKPSNDVNADFQVYHEAESDAELIADKCAQFRELRRVKGENFSEPLWYACLGVLSFCVDSEKVIHDWASGSAHYSPDSPYVDNKIAQFRATGVGPTTCAHIGGCNPAGCIGCPHNNKIKSPIVLGRPEPKEVEIPDEQCAAPDGFRRGDDGLYAEEDGRWVKFYDQDLYPDVLAYDESLGHEVMLIKHSLPFEGRMECTIRSSIVNDSKALITLLSDNHIKVVGVREKKYMTAYLESYQQKLQRQRRMTMLLCQMGWKTARNGNPMFVLGRKIYHADGTCEDASLARNVPKAAEGYRTAGSLEKWTAMTKILDRPGMEPFAFALLAGGFGAPLMKFTGFDGALVSLVGQSGVGKSLMLMMIQSVWGYEKDLTMMRDDTRNAQVSRLGVYGNLPLTIDEMTNIQGMDLSDLVYRITQGKDKVRLTKNSEEKKNINTWNTLAVASSNASLIEKLSEAKQDSGAEMNRVFEYIVHRHDEFQGEVTKDAYWTMQENYGHAGQVYAAWLAQNIDRVKHDLEKVRQHIDSNANIKGEERFISAVAATAIYGGLIAKKLGLINLSVADVMEWASTAIIDMRGTKNDLAGDSISILCQFLDEHAANRLIVAPMASGGVRAMQIIEAPRGKLVYRVEQHTGRLYMSRAEFVAWVSRRFGSVTNIKNDLHAHKILVSPSKRKTLGAGTFYATGQQVCWEMGMKNNALSDKVQDMIDVAGALEKAPIDAVNIPKGVT